MATNGQPVSVERKMSTSTVATSKFMVSSNDTNCITNDGSTITSNLYSNVNSHATTTTTAIDSPIISSTTRIKPKSSSFLHRDYNRKPILARSQVSMWGDDDVAHNCQQLVHYGYEEKIIIMLLLKLLIVSFPRLHPFSSFPSTYFFSSYSVIFLSYSLTYYYTFPTFPSSFSTAVCWFFSLMTAEIFFLLLLLAVNLIPISFQFSKLVCNFLAVHCGWVFELMMSFVNDWKRKIVTFMWSNKLNEFCCLLIRRK